VARTAAPTIGGVRDGARCPIELDAPAVPLVFTRGLLFPHTGYHPLTAASSETFICFPARIGIDARSLGHAVP